MALHDPSLLGSPTLFGLYDIAAHQEPPWPKGLQAMCAVFDPADAGLGITVTGFDTGGAAVSESFTTTLWDPTSTAPVWVTNATTLAEVTGISWPVREPYGEWLFGNFAVPWRDETTMASDDNTGIYIAYGSILY